MTDLAKIWTDFSQEYLDILNPNLSYSQIGNKNDWDLLPFDLKTVLEINNGQDLTTQGVFTKLNNGKLSDFYKFLDFNSILKYYKVVKSFDILKVKDLEIPFAIKENQDTGGFGFSINRLNYSINYISFNEYDYNGGTLHNKGIFKYANTLTEFIENQRMIKQFK
jgi:hypothetical protein